MGGGLAPVDRQAAFTLIAVELVCVLLLLFANHLPGTALTAVTTTILSPANGVLRWVESIAHARSDATRLSRELAQLRLEHGRSLDADAENARLRALLGFTQRTLPSLKPAQVVGVAGEPRPGPLPPPQPGPRRPPAWPGGAAPRRGPRPGARRARA